MKKVISLYFLCFLVFLSCTKEEIDPITAPKVEDSFLDGLWTGRVTGELERVLLSAELNENFNTVSGTGDWTFSKTEGGEIINAEFTGNITGVLRQTELQFTIYSPSDSDQVIYNGSLHKQDSTIFLGNCTYYNSAEQTYYNINMTINKQ